MTVKEEAKHVIDSLPGEVTMDDIMYALYIATKFDHGEKQITEGKGVSDEHARKRLGKWQK